MGISSDGDDPSSGNLVFILTTVLKQPRTLPLTVLYSQTYAAKVSNTQKNLYFKAYLIASNLSFRTEKFDYVYQGLK